MTSENEIHDTSVDAPESIPSEEEVTFSQNVADTVSAEHVEIHQGGAQTVQGRLVEIHQGGVQFVEADTVVIEQGGSLSIQAKQATLTQSGAGILSAEAVSLGQDSTAGVIIARRVDGPVIRTSVLLAGEVYGNVETTMDSRGALLAGLGIGIGLGVLLSLKRFLGGRD